MAPWLTPSRFPDSDIFGSTLVSSSPKLFAAVHVLLRLSTPRHPPRALHSLTVSLRHDSSFLANARRSARQLSRGQGWLQELNHDRRSYQRRFYFFSFQRLVCEVDDLVRTRQLSRSSRSRTNLSTQRLVELTGIEPVTSGLQSRRSPS